ncbi:MAG TPA: choice-of-anchor B family protein [Gemmatimonadales bacterium]|nr:choice-of-anchor B family protein [Gemmatimonadales bacterium]
MAIPRPRRFVRSLAAVSLAALVLAAPAPASAQEPNFGASAAIAGREILIGQPSNQYAPGLVYVYRAGQQGWREAGRLAAPDSSRADGFGRRLAVEGNTLLVAASPGDSSEGGKVHVYQRSGTGAAAAWRHLGHFAPSSIKPGERFGRALALRGDVAVVGSTRADSLRGAVYVFRRSGTEWREEAKLRPDDVKPGTGFGASLAFDGERIVAAAQQADSNAGAVYVFQRDANGAWTQAQKLTPPLQPAVAKNAQFGATLLLDGRTLYVGAPGMTQFVGAVVRFTYDTAQKRFNPAGGYMPFDVTPFAQFGSSMALVGREIWIGAPNAAQGRGKVFRYTRDSTDAATGATALGYDTTAAHQLGFGGTIVAGGDLAVVGMPNADFGEGRAAILTRTAAGRWTQRPVRGQLFRPAAIAGGEVHCAEGKATVFDCRQVNLLAVVPVAELGGDPGARLNTVWGWTDPETGREYAIVGRSDGTAFLDVTDPTRPRYLGNLPKTPEAPATVWREFKVMHNHVYIVSDGAPKHGMQVFDLTRLRRVRTPQTFTPDFHYTGVSSAHNVAVDSATHTVFITGANAGGETCGGGLHMVDARDPKHPTFLGCFQDMGTGFAGTGYSHDVQCVIYQGPDTRYTGREICFGGNETALSIADVTDKQNPKAIGRGTYPNFGYIHQGWLTEDHRFFYVNDELDELQGKAPNGTRTIIFDVSKLDEPVVAGEFIGTTKATDHNLYIRGDRMYQSNYEAGLRVIDIKDRVNPKEVGYFDVVPVGENGPGFGGTWNNYPYFKSGTILVTSAREGLFLLRDQGGDLTP